MSQVQQAVSALEHEPGVVAHASYYIQCHVKAATFTGTVHALYVAGLHPECRGDDPLVCCPTYNCDAVVAKAWHAQHHDDNIDILAKLVRKGGPAPSSVRYVGGLMKRCASMSPEAARVIRLMLASHFLGGYQNSLVCADPEEHIRLLGMSTQAMLDYATTNSSTRQLHAIVSTFVSSNTQACPPLLWSVGPAAALHAAGVAAGRLRAFGRSTPAAPVTPYSRIILLMKALNVRAPPPSPGTCPRRPPPSPAPRLALCRPTRSWPAPASPATPNSPPSPTARRTPSTARSRPCGWCSSQSRPRAASSWSWR